MTNWREVKLGDICEITSSKRIFMADYVTSGIPFYRSKEIIEKQRGNNISTELFITEEKYEEIKQKFSVPQEGDILLTSVGTIGIPYIVKRTEKFYFKDGNLTWIKKSKQLLTEYLYYFLISTEGKFKLENISIGTTQKAITIVGLKGLEISLPPIDTQKNIAGILSALDDKIELNNKINNNLEQQAQVLFKSWFIDFEPFGGKKPNDWKEINLSDIATFVGGYSYKGSELQTSSTAMATIKNFDRQGGFKLDGFKEILPSSKLKETQKVDLFDILVAHTDLTQNADVIGNAEMLLSKAGYLDVIISMDIVKVLPQTGVSKFLLAALLKDNRFKQHSLGYINGTTVLHLSKKALSEYTFAFPNNVDTVDELTQTLEYLYKKLASNIEENTRLAQLRDTLLPKLMSGEIDVSNVNISADKSSFSEKE